jgi:hypothetical protein
MDLGVTEHMLNGIHVPNILIYMFAIVTFSLLFALVIAKDMDSKEDQEECFSAEVQAKIAAFNELQEEPSKEQIAEIYEEIDAKEAESDDTSEGDDLPDVLLIVRAKYIDAEELLAGKKNIEVVDVKFLDFYPSLYTNIPQNLKKIRRNSL